MKSFLRGFHKWRYRSVVFVFVVILCFNCIDPYSPDIKNFESLLVVDALITDEDAPNYVRLLRSSQTQGEYDRVIGAQVEISDDQGNSVILEEKEYGEYWTDPATFRGEVGKSYNLRIVTYDGKEYISDTCFMYPVTDIDSVYYDYYEAVPEGYTSSYAGINISVASQMGSVTGFRRWKYEEWWKFRIPNPVVSRFISETEIVPVPLRNDICWGHSTSNEILLNSEMTEGGDVIHNPILFLPTQLTNRFQIQYSIEIRELSISRAEYDFWRNLEMLNEAGGDIFDKQPFTVVGNVRSADGSERALGYFQVSAVSKQQVYITEDDIHQMGLSRYYYECERFTASPGDYDFPVDWEYVYEANVNKGYTYVSYEVNSDGDLAGLTFVLPFCADCSLTGESSPPDFWVDL